MLVNGCVLGTTMLVDTRDVHDGKPLEGEHVYSVHFSFLVAREVVWLTACSRGRATYARVSKLGCKLFTDHVLESFQAKTDVGVGCPYTQFVCCELVKPSSGCWPVYPAA